MRLASLKQRGTVSQFGRAYRAIQRAFLETLESRQLFAADGFATGVTGGEGGSIVTATTASEFKNFIAQSAPLTIQVAGTIDLRTLDGANGRVFTQSNKTIVGIGNTPTVIGNLNISGVSNVIVDNLYWTNPQDGADGLTIWNGKNVWVNHVSFYDCGDGMCDINNGSDYVTVSWSKFYYPTRTAHKFTMIADGTSTQQAHITLHHNWWAEGCDQRMPASSYAFVHAYDNYFTSTGNSYAQNARTSTQMLSENNYFKSVQNPVTVSTGTTGLIRTSGNIYDNTIGTIYHGADTVFAPPYAYTLDPTIAVPAMLTARAGVLASPEISSGATAILSSNGKQATLSVSATDDRAESDLTYTWSVLGTPPASVNFSANGSNSAKSVTANFTKAGSYQFQVTVTDTSGLSASSIVSLNVNAALTSIIVTPTSATIAPSATQTFSATARDQFDNSLTTQPTFAWSATAGEISSLGQFKAPLAASTASITATSGSVSGSATVTIGVAGSINLTVNQSVPSSATNFATIQSAIDSIPNNNVTPYYIRISPGVYSEIVTVPVGKDFITIDGGSAHTTTIRGISNTSFTGLLNALANNLTVENITLDDIAGPTAGPNSALVASGDRQVYLNTTILGYQDTLYLGKAFTRQYFENCTIGGSVDFIYGASTAVFNDCSIIQRSGGTAMFAPSTPQGAAYGLVFIDSHLINGGNMAPASTALARAWNSPYGMASFIHTNMDDIISLPGWTNFGSTTSYATTERYIEYGSYGPGAAGYLAVPSQRAPQAVNLTDVQATAYADLSTWTPNWATLFNGWNPTAVGSSVPVNYIGNDGVWENSANWSTGSVPLIGQAVFVRSGSLTITSAANIDSLSIGTASAGATLSIAATGRLTVGGQLSTFGTSSMPSSVIDAGSVITGSIRVGNSTDQLRIRNNAIFNVQRGLAGSWPAGNLIVEQGVVNVSALGGYAAGPVMQLGTVAGSTGTWNVLPGDVQYPHSIRTGAGTSVINISGGTINGTYGPDLGGVAAGGNATINQNSGLANFLNMNLGSKAGTYTFNQTGGTFQSGAAASSNAYDWLIGDASGAVSTWNLSGSGTVVKISDLFVGKNGVGKVVQSNGSFTLNQPDASQLPARSGMRLGWGTNGSGTYSISGGSFAIQNGGLTLGFDSTTATPGIGTFQIIGGTAGALNITGNYTQSSKSVLAAQVTVSGLSTLNVTGNVAFASGATVLPSYAANASAGTYTLMTWTGSASGIPTLASGVDPAKFALVVGANSISLVVKQAVSTLTINPSTTNLNAGGTKQFSATAFDQFGKVMQAQPSIEWSLRSGGGSINSSGLYSAPSSSTSAMIAATANGISTNATIMVTNSAPTLSTVASASPSPVTGKTTTLNVLGADDSGESNLVYTWSVLGTPPAAASFSINGSNAAKKPIATFAAAGSYSFLVTIRDPGGLTTTSSVNVTVNQTLTTIAVAPATVSINAGTKTQFSFSATDQFGKSFVTPPSVTWSLASGTGSISSTGQYTAPSIAGSAVIKAASGGISGTGNVNVIASLPSAPSNLKATVVNASQINLTWTDNSTNETSLVLERATNSTFTTGILTTTLAANAVNQNVTGLAANTTYYFRLRARNAAGYSAFTSTISAKTKVATIVYQAESATIGGGTTIDKNWSGYNGTGFVNLPSKNGFAEFSVNAPLAGMYTLTFRYALGSSTSRNVAMTLNGGIISGGLTFNNTGSWTTWSTVSMQLTLTSGTNRIRLTSTGQDAGNIDDLTVSPI